MNSVIFLFYHPSDEVNYAVSLCYYYLLRMCMNVADLSIVLTFVKSVVCVFVIDVPSEWYRSSTIILNLVNKLLVLRNNHLIRCLPYIG